DSAEAQDKPLAKTFHAIKKPTEKFADMVDIHTLSAGWTFAFALVSLGLSARKISSSAPALPPKSALTRDDQSFADTLSNLERPRRANSPAAQLLETSDLPRDDRPVAFVPAARFWLI